MCIFCRAFEVLYGVESGVATDRRRWQEYNAIALGGKSQEPRRQRRKPSARRMACPAWCVGHRAWEGRADVVVHRSSSFGGGSTEVCLVQTWTRWAGSQAPRVRVRIRQDLRAVELATAEQVLAFASIASTIGGSKLAEALKSASALLGAAR